MKFDPPLQRARFLKRYKRFLTDVTLKSGETVTIHCPNTGSMKNCLAPNSWCWFSVSDNPKRKYPYTWEIATTPDGSLAGINTARSNALVVEAIESGVITELEGYTDLRCEVPYGEERSRIDILLHYGERRCYVEVKNVTLSESNGLGLFPDAVSTRGTKHLRELIAVTELGHRAVLLFCVQHTGIDRVQPADAIDAQYGKTLRQAVAQGVEVLAYRTVVGPGEIAIRERIPFELPQENALE